MQTTYNEHEIITKAQQGREEAISSLYEAHAQPIFDYISYRVESIALAEDLTAEVFLRMVRGLPNYQDKGLPFRAWLFRIAANLITDHYRQVGHQQREAIPISESHESDDPDPFDELAKKEEGMQLRQAIRMLPTEYQDLLVLRFVEELPYAEIAKVMNKSVVALRAMQHRALKALAEQLAKIDPEYSWLWGNRR
jgi:RNA polymerase sigma-70 factor, ECF subfamily